MRYSPHTLTRISVSASYTYTAAASAFLQEWQKISLANKDRILMGKKPQLVTIFICRYWENYMLLVS